MARFTLIVAILLTLTGCPPKPPEPDNATVQQLAQRTAELEQARDGKSFWQSTAAFLCSFIVLALLVGIILGSKAKDDANGQ